MNTCCQRCGRFPAVNNSKQLGGILGLFCIRCLIIVLHGNPKSKE